jgi:late competence protein required for DNA uptake (superfamily II DNA/RNA helicase)
MVAMRKYECTNCGEAVASNEATLRSVAFRQVAYCRTCRDEVFGTVEVPQPRAAVDQLASTVR